MVYYASELNHLTRNENGGKIPKAYFIKYDPQDLRYVYIYDDENDCYHALSLSERPIEPFTKRNLEISSRQKRETATDKLDQHRRLDAIQERREFLTSRIEGNKRARRTMASERSERGRRSRTIPLTNPMNASDEDDNVNNDSESSDNTSSEIVYSTDDQEEEVESNEDLQ